MRLKWEALALHNLSDILEYIEKSNPAAAAHVGQRIQNTAMNLKSFPLLGRPAEIGDIRLLQVPLLPYLLPYEVRGETIHILAVFDERQNRPREWK